MQKSILRSWILCAALALTSCVTVRDDSALESYSEKWCYYNRAGIYKCTTCYGAECTCNVSAMELCSYGMWERACRACYENRFSDFESLYGDPRLIACSPQSLCNLCSIGSTTCGPYPRPEWRIDVHMHHPPSPPRGKRHRGRPDDFPPPRRGR